jgi:hypothetical protein
MLKKTPLKRAGVPLGRSVGDAAGQPGTRDTRARPHDRARLSAAAVAHGGADLSQEFAAKTKLQKGAPIVGQDTRQASAALGYFRRTHSEVGFAGQPSLRAERAGGPFFLAGEFQRFKNAPPFVMNTLLPRGVSQLGVAKSVSLATTTWSRNFDPTSAIAPPSRGRARSSHRRASARGDHSPQEFLNPGGIRTPRCLLTHRQQAGRHECHACPQSPGRAPRGCRRKGALIGASSWHSAAAVSRPPAGCRTNSPGSSRAP